MSDTGYIDELQSDEELLKFLGRKNTEAISDKVKPDEVLGRKNAASDTSAFDNAHSSGYDLTNPNLHYGTRFQGHHGPDRFATAALSETDGNHAALEDIESPSLQPRASHEETPDRQAGAANDGSASYARAANDPASIENADLNAQSRSDAGRIDPQSTTNVDFAVDERTSQPGDAVTQSVSPSSANISPDQLLQSNEPQSHAPVITSNGGGDQASIRVDENNLFVTKVAATDLDPNSTLTYTIAGGDDAALFSIDPLTGELIFKNAPDHENPGDTGADNIYDVIVQVSDGTHVDQQRLAIAIDNVNEGPSGATLTSNNINENSAAGTVVGTVHGVDPDAGATFTYQIVGGDSAKYQIDATTGAISLKAGVALDYEADASDSVTIRVTDQGGLSTDQTFAININNVNEGPTGATLTSNNINENSAAGTVVGTVHGVDPDAGATFTYQIVGGDSAKYQIDATTGAISLKAGVALDYEADASDSVTIRVTDQGGLSTDQTFAIAINNVNEGPSGATLTNNNINENSAAGTVVGTVHGVDPDAGATFTYQIVGGDSAKYQIDATTGAISLKAGVALDYEADASDSVTIRVTDQGGLSTDQTFAIAINNVNEGPSGATLTNNNINENSAAGTVVGTVHGVDPDAGATFTYQIVGGDSAKYQIDATTGAISLKAGVALDYEADASDSVTIRVTDQGGLSTDQTFAIAIDNVNEGPTGATLTSNNINENSAAGTVVGTVHGVDPDAGATFTYSIVGGDSAKYQIDANTGAISLKAGVALDYEADASDSVTIRVTDQGGLSTDQTFAIAINNVNEGPSGISISTTTLQEDVVSGGTIGTTYTNANHAFATLTTTDPDAGETFTYQIVGGDSAKYEIVNGNQIQVKAGVSIDYETDNADSITVRVTDSGGHSIDQQFNFNISNVSGSATGTSGADKITGTSEEDTITGGGGNDYIDGGAGSDTVNYSGAHTDYSFALNSDGTIAVTDLRSGSPDGTDTLVNVETLHFSDQNSGFIVGTTSNDTLNSTNGNDVLVGGDGNDTFNASYGLDVFDGGAGTDTISYASMPYNMTIDLNAGLGYVTGYVAGADRIYNIENATGGSLDDVLIGNSAANVLNGGNGNDVLIGGAGADTLIGGAGTDTANYSASLNGVTVNLTTNVNKGGDAQDDSLSGIENITGSGYADTLTGDANANVIDGGAGNDTITGGGGTDTLNGGDGNDNILWTADSTWTATNALNRDSGASVSITGFDQSYDIVDGGAGTDTLTGTSASDYISINNGSNRLISNIEIIDAGDGNDVVDLSASSFVATENFDVRGGAGNDVLWTDAGNDTITGGSGNDTIDGGAGTDVAVYSGASANYSLTLNADGTVTIVDMRSGSPDGTDTLSGIETLRFSDGDFTLQTGTTYAETMTGTSGQDITLSGDGNDQFSGTAGNDILDGGAAWWDTIDYSSQTSNLSINLTTGTASGGTIGTDTIKNFEEVWSGSGSDTITGNATAATMIYAGAGNDTITTGSGEDYIEGQSGADTINGGAGNDWAVYWSSGSGVTVNLGTNVNTGGDAQGDSLTNVENVWGSWSNDTLTGNTGDNFLYGDVGNDTLNGGDGNDTLKGGAGTDYIDGGAGTDTVVYSGNAIDYDFSVSGGYGVITDLRSGSPDGTDYISGIEKLQFGDQVYTAVAGTNYNDTLTGTTGNDGLFGLDGNDTLIGGSGGNDLLVGGAGNDTIRVEGGADTLIGGTGTDVLDLWTSGDVTVNLAAGTVSGGGTDGTRISGFETVWGGDSNDTIIGTSAAEQLYGYNGNDTIDGGGGNDYLDGESGTDTVSFGTASTGVTASLATTSAQNTGVGTMTILNFENMTGSAYNDTLTGNSSNNTMSGGAGSDTIYAGSGNDTIIGGTGNDTLYGQNGADIFTYYTGDGNDTIIGGLNSSTGSWTDTIDLHSDASTLGTYGVDWTVTLTTGTINSVDTANHALSLSNDAAGTIHLHDGSTVNFSELERITWS